MLIKSRLHFLFVSEDVWKACRQFRTTFAVKDYLASADVAVSNALFVHEIESPQNLLSEVFQDWFWNCTDTLCQIVNTTIRCVISNYWNAAFWTVPLSMVDFYKAITGRVSRLLSCTHTWWDGGALTIATVMLPIGYPVDKHLSNLYVCDRDFFDSIDFQTWRMQHLLNCSRCTFEDSERYHLIKPNWQLRIVFLTLNLHHFLLMHLIDVFTKRIRIIIRECTA